jgi:hypothetical protein
MQTPFHTAPVGLYHRPRKRPARTPKLTPHTGDEISDLKVRVCYCGLRPLRHNRRRQYRDLVRFRVI